MQVVLISKNKLYKTNLYSNIENSYWITDKTSKTERKIINIIAYNGEWEIESNNYAQIINSKNIRIENNKIRINDTERSIVSRIKLKENNMYAIRIPSLKEIYILYCAPERENNFLHFDIQDIQEITIGSNDWNSIVYKNALIASNHARIFKNEEEWFIQNYDTRYGTFLNNIQIGNKIAHISNGDIIYIMGLKIIMMKNSIYINNPNNSISYNKRHLILDQNQIKVSDIKKQVIEDEQKIGINKEYNYYSKAPRITNLIETEYIKIDEPPQLDSKKDRPIYLVLGASVAMGLMMIFSMFSMGQREAKGKEAIIENTFNIFMIILMLISMLIIPILDVKYDKKAKLKYEQKRQKKYKEYLRKKKELINGIKNKQRKILYQNYISNKECLKIILEDNPRLWERSIEDEDFLSIRLGIGEVPLKISISYPEEKFKMEEDDLLDILNKIVIDSRNIERAPITVPLAQNNISAIICKDYNYVYKFMQNIILQLIAFHSYVDLKLVFLLNKNTSNNWEFLKMLPHIWNNEKTMRFFADDIEDIHEISQYLGTELKNRLAKEPDELEKEAYKKFEPYYLIITDNYKKIENVSLITELSELKTNLGFSLLCITDNIVQLPDKCTTFINIENEAVANIFENRITEKNQKAVKLDQFDFIDYREISHKLSNIHIRIKAKTETTSLPKGYAFLEMFNVGRIEKLNILERWKKNNTTLSLKTPIGVDSEGEVIYLDAHERFHGPHGLIAGATGSGKSEFIITYILSLAVNYHPDDVTFLLIDYKGGGLAGAFQKQNIKLPHLVGTITNIDTNGLKRSLISIQSELRRRQKMFNDARNITNEGTIDIYKYQTLYHEGVVNEPIPHLFIICDEFAELKQQQTDFMDELISVSRIGRSLGVHLILATQKPSGIVDDQIRSNSKFAVCLKVQDTTDSMDVIARKDAAYLKNAGQFFLRVGQDEYFTLGQSGWAGEQYIPSNVAKKTIDTSIEFISNIGVPIKRVDNVINKSTKSQGEQLTNLVTYISELANQQKIRTKNLWLENIPETIYVNDIRTKYKIRNKKDEVQAIIGEYDDPFNQKQGIVKINLKSKENVAVFGNAESGKETLLSTFIYDLMTNYTTEQVQMYILDFGSEALKIFAKSPHVGDIVFSSEDEKIHRLFEMIIKEIKTRKAILSNYNGDYELYISKGNKMPLISIVINNYDAFAELYESMYDDLMLTITREGSKYGVIFIVTASGTSNMRYRLLQNFGNKIALQLNNSEGYYEIFDKIGEKKIPHIFGRGLISIDNNIFEFQIAKICEGKDYNIHVEQTIQELDKINKIRATHIRTIPEVLNLQSIKEHLTNMSEIPIGMLRKNLNIFTYDFTTNFMNIITSKNINDAIEYSSYIAEAVRKIDNTNIKIINLEKSKNVESDSKKFITELKKEIKKKEEKFTLYQIIGISKFIESGVIDSIELDELLSKVKKTEKFSFIIIDLPSHLQEYTYESWYTNNIKENSGIWVGNGIEEQILMSPDYESEDLNSNCGRTYGYVIEQGDATLIKLIGMAEADDKK